MGREVLSRRMELALLLLGELKNNYIGIENAANCTAANSRAFFEEALSEMKEKLQSITDNYHKNIKRIREINDQITLSVNGWYAFVKDEQKRVSLMFPLLFFIKKKRLSRKISMLNKEISEITIQNRFIKEKYAAKELELRIRADSLARSGDQYRHYEKLLQKQRDLEAELKYLLPTIPGIYSVDISKDGINSTIAAVEELFS